MYANKKASIAWEDWSDGPNSFRSIYLERPERRNSLPSETLTVLQGLVSSGSQLHILLTAAPPVFSAGLDLDELGHSLQVRGGYERYIGLLIRLYTLLLRHPRRTLVVVDGPAVGGGVGLAMCFDHILSTNNGSFRLPDGALRPFASIVFPIAFRRHLELWEGNLLSARDAYCLKAVDMLVSDRPDKSVLRDLARRIADLPSATFDRGVRNKFDRRAERLRIEDAFAPRNVQALARYLKENRKGDKRQ